MPFSSGQRPWNYIESDASCRFCGKKFHIAPAKLKDKKTKRGIYCSRICKDKALIGKDPWNKGLKGTQSSNGGSFGRVKSLFLGTRKEYYALHYKIRKMWGKADLCEINSSHEYKRYHWANKNGKYELIKKDWIKLCPKCHYLLDHVESRRNKNIKENT